MIRFAAAYLAAGLVFAVIDASWLSLMGPKVYKPVLSEILADNVRLIPAIAFYALYIAGIVILAVAPALKDGGWRQAMLAGAVLGLVAYGAYDLTNQATLRVWATHLTLLDLAYGVVATCLAALAGERAAQWAGRAFAS